MFTFVALECKCPLLDVEVTKRMDSGKGNFIYIMPYLAQGYKDIIRRKIERRNKREFKMFQGEKSRERINAIFTFSRHLQDTSVS